MAVEIKYREPADRPIQSVEAKRQVYPEESVQTYALDGGLSVATKYNGQKVGITRLSLDDAIEFFEAGLKFARQLQRERNGT